MRVIFTFKSCLFGCQDTQHNGTQNNSTLYNTNVTRVRLFYCNVGCCHSECRHAERHYAECCTLSVVILSVLMVLQRVFLCPFFRSYGSYFVSYLPPFNTSLALDSICAHGAYTTNILQVQIKRQCTNQVVSSLSVTSTLV